MYFLKVYSTPYVDKRTEYISNNDKGMIYLNGILKGRDHISHMVNMHYFFKKSSTILLSLDQAEYI